MTHRSADDFQPPTDPRLRELYEQTDRYCNQLTTLYKSGSRDKTAVADLEAQVEEHLAIVAEVAASLKGEAQAITRVMVELAEPLKAATASVAAQVQQILRRQLDAARFAAQEAEAVVEYTRNVDFDLGRYRAALEAGEAVNLNW